MDNNLDNTLDAKMQALEARQKQIAFERMRIQVEKEEYLLEQAHAELARVKLDTPKQHVPQLDFDSDNTGSSGDESDGDDDTGNDEENSDKEEYTHKVRWRRQPVVPLPSPAKKRISRVLNVGDEVCVVGHPVDNINYLCIVEKVEEEKSDTIEGTAVYEYTMMPKGHTDGVYRMQISSNDPRIVEPNPLYTRDQSVLVNDTIRRTSTCKCPAEFECYCHLLETPVEIVAHTKNNSEDTLDDLPVKR